MLKLTSTRLLCTLQDSTPASDACATLLALYSVAYHTAYRIFNSMGLPSKPARITHPDKRRHDVQINMQDAQQSCRSAFYHIGNRESPLQHNVSRATLELSSSMQPLTEARKSVSLSSPKGARRVGTRHDPIGMK